MSPTEFFIKRPAFTIVLSLVISILGILSYRYLPVRWVPSVNPPVVSIWTSYPGANASLVETQITTPIEETLTGIDGLSRISSNSKQEGSSINVTFKQGYNLNTAVENIRSALQRISDGLPTGAKPPSIEKADPNGIPILFLSFSNAHMSQKEVSDYVKKFVEPHIKTAEGVATVAIFGERESTMKISLDPTKMAASNISVDDVNKALTEQNISVPSGQIRSAKRFYSVITNIKLKSATEFNDIIIRDDQNQVVRIKDIGSAEIDSASDDSAFRVNSESAIAIGIIPQSNANPLDVSKQVLKEFKEIQKKLPNGMKSDVVFNQATFIQASVDHVYRALIEATILVLLVIFLFLASWRAALIPIVTIPVCLIGTFSIIYLCGFSINIITLMALVLAIGLVVDDAIVMLENISRYIEQGANAFTAAIKGSREIIFPIIAMTLTLAAVYAPIMFTPGLLGTVFKEFAVTLAGAVIISGFVALTLSPMMCARFLKKTDQAHSYQAWLNTKFSLLQTHYRHLLEKVLGKKAWVVALLIIIGISGVILFRLIPSELAPTEDMNEVDVFMTAPRDASFEYTDSYARQLEKIYYTIPEVTSQISQVGGWSPTKGFQILMLKPQSQRTQTAEEIAQKINMAIKDVSGLQAYVSAPPSPIAWLTDDDGKSIEMQFMTTMEYKELHEVMKQFKEKLQTLPALKNVDSRLKWDGLEFEVDINREKAADAHVPISNITNTISTLLAGKNIGHFDYGNKQYNVTMQMNKNALADPNIISTLYVKNTSNQMVPLSNLISVHETVSPEVLPHFERLRSDKLNADIAPGYTVADAVEAIQQTAKQYLPDSVKYDFVGVAHEYLDSSGSMAFTFMMALIFIYLILVAQFESFIDPFIILLTVPFAMIGALLTLKIIGGSLNIYSNIGLVSLIGLIAKHGILITDFANQQRASGLGIQEAVIEAAKLRLRPILMTTAAMILGALPLALSSGSGAETRQQIGWVIVGGLLIGTFFSLIVVPVAYTYLSRLKEKVRLTS